MQTVETQLAEGLKELRAKSSVKLNRVLSEVAGKSVEQQLAMVKDALKESPRTPKNNHAGPYLFDESDPSTWPWAQADDITESDQVRQTAKEFGFSLREAAIFCGMPDPGKDAKFSAELQETLTEKWSGMKGLLSESEIKTLVAKGIQP